VRRGGHEGGGRGRRAREAVGAAVERAARRRSLGSPLPWLSGRASRPCAPMLGAHRPRGWMAGPGPARSLEWIAYHGGLRRTAGARGRRGVVKCQPGGRAAGLGASARRVPARPLGASRRVPRATRTRSRSRGPAGRREKLWGDPGATRPAVDSDRLGSGGRARGWTAGPARGRKAWSALGGVLGLAWST
jgi:hypothetical protein